MENLTSEDSMRKLIGSELEVHLKHEDEPLYGLLVTLEENELYLRVPDVERVLVIPRANVSYIATSQLPLTSRVLEDHRVYNNPLPPPPPPPQPYPEQVQASGLGFQVIINEQLICQIPVPPTFRLDIWHDDIMRIALNDPDVKVAMLGRTQKKVEYFAPDDEGWAQVKFEVDVDENAMTQQVLPKQGGNTFSMGQGGNPTTEYLSPSQMVARMNNMRGKKDG